jgi:hypothetical protein
MPDKIRERDGNSGIARIRQSIAPEQRSALLYFGSHKLGRKGIREAGFRVFPACHELCSRSFAASLIRALPSSADIPRYPRDAIRAVD